MRASTPRLAGGLLAAAVMLAPSVARADRPLQCIAAADDGQRDRSRGAFLSARENFLACTADDCPAMVRASCVRWLAEIDAALPRVVFAATLPNGDETLDVRVTIDGKVLVERLNGTAIAVDPGRHALRFETPGARPVEKEIVFHEGDRNRPVAVAFEPLAPSRSTPVSAASPSSSEAKEPLPWTFYALGGLGVAGLAGAVYFDATGTAYVSHLRETCGLSCSSGDVAFARRTLVVGDVSLVVGLLALSAATWIALSPRPSRSAVPSTGRASPAF